MRLRVCAVGVALAMAASFGCSQEDRPSPLPATPPASSGAESASAPALLSAEPEPTLDMLELEGKPGATPALGQVDVMPGPQYPGLPGTPGPSPAMGPETARVKVFVFSDFQCPVCSRIVEPLKQIARTYPDEVQIVFKHNPLEMHAQARQAAAAAIAAYRQGKFWEYHDKLFQNQAFLNTDALLRYAEELGLDVMLFQEDMTAPMVSAQIDYERALAEKLGSRGTPGFFINGKKLAGWASYPGFLSMIEDARREAEKVVAQGIPPDQVARMATVAAGDDGKLLAELMWGVKP
jgi:protein-disulfide isomerase